MREVASLICDKSFFWALFKKSLIVWFCSQNLSEWFVDNLRIFTNVKKFFICVLQKQESRIGLERQECE